MTFSSLYTSGVQTGQNVLDDSRKDELKKKRKQTDIVTQKKWTWKDEFFESFIGHKSARATLHVHHMKRLIPGAAFSYVNQMNLLG